MNFVAGDGYLKNNLIEYAKENKLTNIKFLDPKSENAEKVISKIRCINFLK